MFDVLKQTPHLGITILIAADRYVHMDPDFHRSSSCIAKLIKRPYIYISIFCVCLYFALESTGVYLMMHYMPQGFAHFALYNMIFILLAIIFTVGMYTRGYLRIRSFAAENPVYANRGESNSNESPQYLKELFKTVFLLLIVMAISWLPMLITNAITAFNYFITGTSLTPESAFFSGTISLLLLQTNSVTNAMIIFYRNKKSKKWLMTKVCRSQRMREEELSSTVVISNTYTTGL